MSEQTNYKKMSDEAKEYALEKKLVVAKKQERLLARTLRKTLIGTSWEREAVEAYDEACKATDCIAEVLNKTREE